jgi:hypothetical protein
MTDHLGPYELRGELGRGAMAVVWRGFDPNLEREVAIKEPFTLPGDEALNAELSARFVREGRAAAKLNHPGIVTIHNADVFDSRPAIVMELIEGETLSTVLERGPLPAQAALAILDQLLDAVAYAHERDVVHRDIKPDNVFVTHDGRVILADFGIAHVGDSGTLKTQAGTVMGTPGYMAPEQVEGGAVDARTDIFAVGAIAYEMLSGHNPFGADEGAPPTTVMYRIVHEQPPALPASALAEVPVALAPIIGVALAKNPADRFSDAHAFRVALGGGPIVTGAMAGIAAPPAHVKSMPAWATAERPAPRVGPEVSKWLPYAAVVGVAVLLLAIFLRPNDLPATSTAGGGGLGVSPPEVSIVTPTTGSSFDVGTTVQIQASVKPDTGRRVIFLANGVEIGTADSAPYECAYSASSAGSVVLAAKVKLPDGTEVSSEQVGLTVTQSDSSSPADSSTGDEGEIQAALNSWTRTIDNGDLEAHLDCYSPTVSPWYDHSSASRSVIGKALGVAYTRYSSMSMTLSDVSISFSTPEQATAEFTKHWRFSGGGKKSVGSERDVMSLELVGGEWKICSEAPL